MAFLSSNGGWLIVPNGGTKAARVDLIFRSEHAEDDMVQHCLCQGGRSCKLCRLQKRVKVAESSNRRLKQEQDTLSMSYETLINEWNQMVDEQGNEAEEWRIRAQEAEAMVEEHLQTIANLEHKVFNLVNKMEVLPKQPAKKVLQEMDAKGDGDETNSDEDESGNDGDKDDNDNSDDDDSDYFEPSSRLQHSFRTPAPRSHGRSTNNSQSSLLDSGGHGFTGNSLAQHAAGTLTSTDPSGAMASQNNVIRGPKQQRWTNSELRALISLVTTHRKQRPGPDGKKPKILHDMNLFRLMSLQLEQQHGIERSAGACKNEWNRRGRKLSGIDNRKIANPGRMSTSVQ